jgi:para-nitrobenzyl esterase
MPLFSDWQLNGYEGLELAQAGSSALATPVLALYPFASYPTGGEALGASGTDGVFSCAARIADQSQAKFVPTYAYEFNDENAPPRNLCSAGY